MTRESILSLDVSQGLDMALEAAFVGTDFVLDRCGSEVAAQHKLRGGSPFMLVFENHTPVARPEAIHAILDLALAKGVPLMLVCPEPLPEASRLALNFVVKVVEPPIYPYRLLRDVRSFRWVEESVYVMRMPGAKAKSFVAVHLASGAAPAVEKDLRDFWEARGNRYLHARDEAQAAEMLRQSDRAILLVDTDGDLAPTVSAIRGLAPLLRCGGVVPLVPAAACTPAALATLLQAGALTVLPAPAPAEDLGELYDGLRFLRERKE
jgi:hypothetical protein